MGLPDESQAEHALPGPVAPVVLHCVRVAMVREPLGEGLPVSVSTTMGWSAPPSEPIAVPSQRPTRAARRVRDIPTAFG